MTVRKKIIKKQSLGNTVVFDKLQDRQLVKTETVLSKEKSKPIHPHTMFNNGFNKR